MAAHGPVLEVLRQGGQRYDAEKAKVVPHVLLIYQDVKVMTAAHVVHAMDEIRVDFMGSEIVTARDRRLPSTRFPPTNQRSTVQTKLPQSPRD